MAEQTTTVIKRRAKAKPFAAKQTSVRQQAKPEAQADVISSESTSICANTSSAARSTVPLLSLRSA